ncbi:MAG: hypothetical protein U1D35_05585 [Paracoccaceae bacterium]|nr:hypothetical protein [Paracoccaceae bacterium]
MILGWIRLAAIVFLVLSLAYWLVSVYSRSVRREWLEKRFDAGGVEGDREDYIAEGMIAYEKGLRRKLIWLVYIIPTAAMLALVYLLNFA